MGGSTGPGGATVVGVSTGGAWVNVCGASGPGPSGSMTVVVGSDGNSGPAGGGVDVSGDVVGVPSVGDGVVVVVVVGVVVVVVVVVVGSGARVSTLVRGTHV